MFINKLIKKPILPIAFLLTYLLIHQLEEKKIINLSERADILKATSCRAVLVNLKRRVPKDWLTSCENNILTIEVEKPIETAQLIAVSCCYTHKTTGHTLMGDQHSHTNYPPIHYS